MQKEQHIPEDRRIVDRDFGLRFERICDDHPRVPAKAFGRLGYIANGLEKVAGTKVSIESVRRWFGGEARPRPTNMKQLARLLDVDLTYLSFGTVPRVESAAKKRTAILPGAAELVSAIIKMDGGVVSYPPEKSSQTFIHFYAIIKGEMHSFHVASPVPRSSGWRVTIATGHPDVSVMVAIRRGFASFDLLSVPNEAIKAAEATDGLVDLSITRKGQEYSINLGKENFKLTPISSFSNAM